MKQVPEGIIKVADLAGEDAESLWQGLLGIYPKMSGGKQVQLLNEVLDEAIAVGTSQGLNGRELAEHALRKAGEIYISSDPAEVMRHIEIKSGSIRPVTGYRSQQY